MEPCLKVKSKNKGIIINLSSTCQHMQWPNIKWLLMWPSSWTGPCSTVPRRAIGMCCGQITWLSPTPSSRCISSRRLATSLAYMCWPARIYWAWVSWRCGRSSLKSMLSSPRPGYFPTTIQISARKSKNKHSKAKINVLSSNPKPIAKVGASSSLSRPTKSKMASTM